MLCVWVHGYDPGRLSDGSRLVLCQTLSIECPSPIFFSGMCFVLLFLSFYRFCLVLFCFDFVLSLELYGVVVVDAMRWVHGCDPGRLSGGSRLALYQTLSISSALLLFFFWHVCVCVYFLSIYFGHQVRWTYPPGSHRRKATLCV